MIYNSSQKNLTSPPKIHCLINQPPLDESILTEASNEPPESPQQNSFRKSISHDHLKIKPCHPADNLVPSSVKHLTTSFPQHQLVSPEEQSRRVVTQEASFEHSNSA